MLAFDQFINFFITVAIGLLAGFLFDIYRAVRDLLKLKKVGTCLGDIFFWIVLTGVVFILLLLGNWGEIRFYVLLGIATGAAVYLRLMSKSGYRLVRWFFHLLNRMLVALMTALLFIWRVVSFPFKILWLAVAFPFQLLGRGLGLAGGITKKFGGRVLGRPLQRFRAKIWMRLERLLNRFKPPVD